MIASLPNHHYVLEDRGATILSQSDPAMTTAPRLETERLVLRAHRLSDFDRIAELFESPRSKYINGPLSRGNAWRAFAADVGHWDLLGFGAWAIELREAGDYVGQIGLNLPADFPEREIGWLLWEEFEGHGYAFEAASRARDFAFRTLGWDTLVSYIDPENIRSIQLAERLGATRDPDAATPGGEQCLVYRHPKLPVLTGSGGG